VAYSSFRCLSGGLDSSHRAMTIAAHALRTSHRILLTGITEDYNYSAIYESAQLTQASTPCATRIFAGQICHTLAASDALQIGIDAFSLPQPS